MLRNFTTLRQAHATLTSRSTREAMQLLGVGSSPQQLTALTPAALKAAYLRRAVAVHPDTNKAAPDSTREFQELGEALSVAMSFVTALKNAPSSTDAPMSATAAAAADAAASEDSQRLYMEALERLASVKKQQQQQRHQQPASGAEATDTDRLSHLQHVVDMCADIRNASARVLAAAEPMPERLCGRRSFDTAIAFPAAPAAALHDDTFGDHSSQRWCTFAQAAAGFHAFVAMLPNMVARLRRGARAVSDKKSAGDAAAVEAANRLGFQPLALVGALVFYPGRFCGMLSEMPAAARADLDAALRTSSVTTTLRPEDLASVHAELTCVVGVGSIFAYTDSPTVSFVQRTNFLNLFTPTFAEWQVRSAARLKQQSRLLVACRMLSLEVGAILPELTCAPNLALSQAETAQFAERIEKIVDEASRTSVATADDALRKRLSEAGDKLDALPNPLSPHPLRKHMISCSLVARSATSDDGAKEADAAATANDDNDNDADSNKNFRIRRSRAACRIEDQEFDVQIVLGDGPAATAANMCSACETLWDTASASFKALPAAVAEREASLVQCFTRVFGMPAPGESRFWAHVHRRADFLREHEARIDSIDVHLLTAAQAHAQSKVGDAAVGWCDSGADGEKVTIDDRTLADAALFDDWIEDVVAQCTLARQAQLLTHRFSLFYVARERQLFLPHYISFLNRYIDSAARRVIEAPTQSVGNGGGQNRRQPIELMIGNTLDLRGSSLCVPWDFDLSLLVTLLSQRQEQLRLHAA